MANKPTKTSELKQQEIGEVLIVPITKEYSMENIRKMLALKEMLCDDCRAVGCVWCNYMVPHGHTVPKIVV